MKMREILARREEALRRFRDNRSMQGGGPHIGGAGPHRYGAPPRPRLDAMEKRIDDITKRMDELVKNISQANETKAATRDVATASVVSEEPRDQIKELKEYLTKTMEAVKFSEETPTEESKKEEEAQKKLAASTMVFPKLEKESPSSSTYADAPQIKAEEVVSPATVARPESSTAASEAIIEAKDGETTAVDVETVDMSESEDEGFLTDEEYDILDASDEEAAENAQSAV